MCKLRAVDFRGLITRPGIPSSGDCYETLLVTWKIFSFHSVKGLVWAQNDRIPHVTTPKQDLHLFQNPKWLSGQQGSFKQASYAGLAVESSLQGGESVEEQGRAHLSQAAASTRDENKRLEHGMYGCTCINTYAYA